MNFFQERGRCLWSDQKRISNLVMSFSCLLVIGREVDTPFAEDETFYRLGPSCRKDKIVLCSVDFWGGRVKGRDDGVDRIAF